MSEIMGLPPALAYANGCLRRNQLHLGETCADLLKALNEMSLSIVPKTVK